MSDLISRKALISYIDSGHLRNPEEKVFSENDVVRMIKNFPTAFDKKKVIEELKSNKYATSITLDGNTIVEIPIMKINKAIEIVEKGGIE